MDNHTSLRAEAEQSGGNFTEALVDWPPSLVSTLKGCLGVVALIGVVAEVLTLRRITLFLGSISGHQVKSSTGTRRHDDDLKKHPQLLFSFSICDMLQCGLCAPLVIFRKLSGESFNYQILGKVLRNKDHLIFAPARLYCYELHSILVFLSTFPFWCRSNFSFSENTSIAGRLAIRCFCCEYVINMLFI